MAIRTTAIAAAASLLAGVALAQDPSAATTAAPREAATARQHQDAGMQRLVEAADHLRASVQALREKPAGAERDTALHAAQDALLQTQSAMLALPPGMRGTQGHGSAEYDLSVRQLMEAADSLRASVHAMAQQPAGVRRNDAIRQVNEALLDTQSAMANAYDLQLNAAQASDAATTASSR